MNGHGGSHMKFANDLMCFVCCYYDLDWDHSFSSTPSVLRFTLEHANTVGRYLQWLDDGMWSIIRLRLSLEDPEDLHDFLTGVTMLQDLFQESVYSTHNYLFYCTLVAKFAVVCANGGLHAAPSQAVFMMCQTLTAFRLARTLSHSSDFHQDSSTRTIL